MEAQRAGKAPVDVTPQYLRLNNIRVSNNGGTVTVSPVSPTSPLRTNLVQLTGPPLRKERRFFVIRVDELDTMQYIMMGVCRVCWRNSPAWDLVHAVRYHSNDGGIFNGGVGQRSGTTYTKGDTITCRVAYFGRTKCLVEFLKYTSYVYRHWVHLPATELYATIGFGNRTATLTVEWPVDAYPDLVVPVKRMSCWMGAPSLERNDKDSVVKVTGWNPQNDAKKSLSLTAPKPFSRNFTYFEVEILSVREEDGAIGIGHVPPYFKASEFPGWPSFPHSVGYHSDDGGLHHNGQVAADDANKCKVGDVMGCGVVFGDVADDVTEQEAETVTTYFTKNGALVYQRTSRVDVGGCYPCVTFRSSDASVKINAGAVSKVPTEDMARALNTLNVDEHLACGVHAVVTGSSGLQCSVQATGQGEDSFVQMTARPLEVEQQCFSVTPEKMASSGQVLVGVASKVEATGRPQWLCHYDMTSGKIFTPAGIRLASKHTAEGKLLRSRADGAVTCMVDYRTDNRLFMVFFTKDRVLGRAVSTKSPDTLECATVAVIGAGSSAKVDWSGLQFAPSYRDAKDPPLSQWLAGDEDKIQPVADKPTTRFGRTTSVQSPSHLTMSLPYVEFSVNATSGKMPAVGLTTAESDLYSFVGEKAGEISYDVVTGDIIANNEIVNQMSPETSVEGPQTVGVGMVFTQADVRESQDVVVYFTRDSIPIYQRVMTIATGGTFATLTFPRDGCEVKVVEGVYPKLEDHMMVAWVDNMKTNVQKQDSVTSGTFSAFGTGDFSVSFRPAANTAADENATRSEDDDRNTDAETAAEKEENDNDSNNKNLDGPPASAAGVKEVEGSKGTVVKDTGKVFERGNFVLNKDGEAFIVSTYENGDERKVQLMTKEKQPFPEERSPPNSSTATPPDVAAKSENADPTAEEAGKPDESDRPSKDDEPAIESKPATEPEAEKNSNQAPQTLVSKEEGEEKITTKSKDIDAKVYPRLEDSDFLFLGHQSAHTDDNIRSILGEKEGTDYSEERPSSIRAPSPPPVSSASPCPSPAEQGTTEERKEEDGEQKVEESEGGAFHVRDDVRDMDFACNMLLDPSVLVHERKLRNSLHIEALNESEAKKVLQAINEDMPQEMVTYLAPYDRKLSKVKRKNPATTDSRGSIRGVATPDRLPRNSSSLSSSTSTSRTSNRSMRHNPSSKACLLS